MDPSDRWREHAEAYAALIKDASVDSSTLRRLGIMTPVDA